MYNFCRKIRIYKIYTTIIYHYVPCEFYSINDNFIKIISNICNNLRCIIFVHTNIYLRIHYYMSFAAMSK